MENKNKTKSETVPIKSVWKFDVYGQDFQLFSSLNKALKYAKETGFKVNRLDAKKNTYWIEKETGDIGSIMKEKVW